MDITIVPSKLQGTIEAIPSKSQAHRLLICAAFADKPTQLICKQSNQDIEATVRCLNALGATILPTKMGYSIVPVSNVPHSAQLNCGESGSTLRFMLPIVGALGVNATFILEGRLPDRPLSPLWEEMNQMGCVLQKSGWNTIACSGKLKPGNYSIDSGISSQFITGLLFAMILIDGSCSLSVSGIMQSKPYINMTLQALQLFGVDVANYKTTGSQKLKSPGSVAVEGDWSNAAFFLSANRLGNNIDITGLDSDSAQGDRAVKSILDSFSDIDCIDAADIPDLIPILAVVAGATKEMTFENIERLRLKESDRVLAVANMLLALGAEVHVTDKTMRVKPAKYRSCTIETYADHRIAMAAAVAATIARGPVTIRNAQCVAKSYPAFWQDYRLLGGNYEQYIR